MMTQSLDRTLTPIDIVVHLHPQFLVKYHKEHEGKAAGVYDEGPTSFVINGREEIATRLSHLIKRYLASSVRV